MEDEDLVPKVCQGLASFVSSRRCQSEHRQADDRFVVSGVADGSNVFILLGHGCDSGGCIGEDHERHGIDAGHVNDGVPVSYTHLTLPTSDLV